MDSFGLMTHEWSDFFGAAAQISGSLVGLVFVALTLNPRLLGAGRDPILGLLARQTFSDFILLLLVSLVMLAPHTNALEVGEMLLSIVVIDVLRVLIGLWRQRAQWFGRASAWELLQRFLLSFVGHSLLGCAGVALICGHGTPDKIGSLLLAGVLMLLLSGCRSAWLLVTHESK